MVKWKKRKQAISDEELEKLEAETGLYVEVTDAMTDAVQAINEERNAYMEEHVLPQIGELKELLEGDDADASLAQVANLIRKFGGTPAFSNMAEFNQWMNEHRK